MYVGRHDTCLCKLLEFHSVGCAAQTLGAAKKISICCIDPEREHFVEIANAPVQRLYVYPLSDAG